MVDRELASFRPALRDLEVIVSELRLIAAIRRAAGELGAPIPRIEMANQLLDEWNTALWREAGL